MSYSRETTTTADPFSGAFSQERTSSSAASWPVLQWHGGLASLVGESDSMKITGGFFLEDDRVLDLGLDPEQPAAGFERVALRLGGKLIAGWGASQLSLAVLFTDFCWEDRESGRLRFPAEEYERRKQQMPGTERELRGRTRALVAVDELVQVGVTEPLILSVRGTYSASLNAILRDAQRMATEATKLRHRAGQKGIIPREAFWLTIYASGMSVVGEGNNTSRVSLPQADIPAAINRDFLIQALVEEPLRRPGGTFDRWAEQYEQVWHEKMALDEQPVEPPLSDEEDLSYDSVY